MERGDYNIADFFSILKWLLKDASTSPDGALGGQLQVTQIFKTNHEIMKNCWKIVEKHLSSQFSKKSPGIGLSPAPELDKVKHRK